MEEATGIRVFGLGSRRGELQALGSNITPGGYLAGFGMIQPWESQAACKDSDLKLWFGDDDEHRGRKAFRSRQQTEQAKAICDACPVLQKCRSWALEARVPYGILGSLTEADRERIWAAEDGVKYNPNGSHAPRRRRNPATARQAG